MTTAPSHGNPYITLGIPFGASREAASVAFARAARGLRRARDGAERLTELTWALNQIEEALKDPRVAMDVYRVPAHPHALRPDELGVFHPPPEPLEPQFVAQAPADLATLREAARIEVRAALFAECSLLCDLPPR